MHVERAPLVGTLGVDGEGHREHDGVRLLALTDHEAEVTHQGLGEQRVQRLPLD